MKQATLLVLAVLLVLTQGCRSPNGGGGEDAESIAGEPQMRPPSPEAPVYVPGQDEEVDAPDQPSEDADEGVAVPMSESPAYRFKVGDGVVINITGITPANTFEDIVDEHGAISLPYIGLIKAEGLTASELEDVVHKAYVPNFYKYATISVFVPTSGYYIRGEVRSPGRFALVPGMTILQAVATAGGYTEYAAETRVRILRQGETIRINLKDLDKHPERDIPLEARDVIVVPRAWF